MEEKSSSSHRKRKHESRKYSINVFINVPTIRLSLSVELQSRIRENNHAMLNQLGPTVHQSSRFDSITIS